VRVVLLRVLNRVMCYGNAIFGEARSGLYDGPPDAANSIGVGLLGGDKSPAAWNLANPNSGV
jgi:hypothetical protein